MDGFFKPVRFKYRRDGDSEISDKYILKIEEAPGANTFAGIDISRLSEEELAELQQANIVLGKYAKFYYRRYKKSCVVWS